MRTPNATCMRDDHWWRAACHSLQKMLTPEADSVPTRTREDRPHVRTNGHIQRHNHEIKSISLLGNVLPLLLVYMFQQRFPDDEVERAARPTRYRFNARRASSDAQFSSAAGHVFPVESRGGPQKKSEPLDHIFFRNYSSAYAYQANYDDDGRTASCTRPQNCTLETAW